MRYTKTLKIKTPALKPSITTDNDADQREASMKIIRQQKQANRDLASAYSRPKGGNESRLNRNYIQTLKILLDHQWNHYPPSWFITIQWTPAPFRFTAASNHAKHFRNKLLTHLYSTSLQKLPQPQDRCKLVWFHERAQDPQGHLIYHSHLHLTKPPGVDSAHHLQWIIADKIAPGFDCLKNLQRRRDPAVVIRQWNPEHHSFYNLKDHYRFWHHQDPDLILDYAISDLICPSK